MSILKKIAPFEILRDKSGLFERVDKLMDKMFGDYEVVNSKNKATPLEDVIQAHSDAEAQGKSIDSTHPLSLPATLRKKPKMKTILTSPLGISDEANLGMKTLLGGK